MDIDMDGDDLEGATRHLPDDAFAGVEIVLNDALEIPDGSPLQIDVIAGDEPVLKDALDVPDRSHVQDDNGDGAMDIDVDGDDLGGGDPPFA